MGNKMDWQCRCPVCNRFGSKDLGGRCKDHVEIPDEKSVFDDFPGFNSEREFIPGDFGVMQNKFGYER